MTPLFQLPESRKSPPILPAKRLAQICNVDSSRLSAIAAELSLPFDRTASTRCRKFSVSDVQRWARATRSSSMRPDDSPAATIAVGNFKGGVGKTTTAMALAQGLSLRGHRVLVIDCDPQGSLTTLFGLLPECEVNEQMTLVPICRGDSADIGSAIQPTYWPGIDLVPAAPLLFEAEYSLPTLQLKNVEFKFWDVLNASLRDARRCYDVIVIDTSPSLSYLAFNAFMAADGIIVPMPTSALDFASAAQFWNQFSGLAASAGCAGSDAKTYSFLHVLLTRADRADAAGPAVREWIKATYGAHVLSAEVPKTTVTSGMAAAFGTVYDVERYEGAARTYQRALDAYDEVATCVERSLVKHWRAVSSNAAADRE